MAFLSRQFPSDGCIRRPDSGSFAAALRSVKGCPGIDGWSSSEIALLCGNKFLLNKAWIEMAHWERAGLAPSSMKDGLLHFIPKPGKVGLDGCCTCKDLRPLSILSVFSRAWSAASFCFDTVDLQLLQEALAASLPSGLRNWSNLLVGHWGALRRWISCCGSILAEPICSPCGICQGDAASPLMLAFFLWEGFCQVDSFLQSSGAEFFQGIYMDDRTVLSSRPDVVEGAVLVWNQFAMRRKLLENMEKAQWSLRYPLWRVMDALWRSSVPLLARRTLGLWRLSEAE